MTDVASKPPKKKHGLILTGVAMLLVGILMAAVMGSIGGRIPLLLSDVARLLAVAGIVVIIIGAVRSSRKSRPS